MIDHSDFPGYQANSAELQANHLPPKSVFPENSTCGLTIEMQPSVEPARKRKATFIDMTGFTIGCLTVTSEAKSVNCETRWNCLCSQCGATTIVPRKHLVSKKLRWKRCWSCPSRGRTRIQRDETRVPSMLKVTAPKHYEPPRPRRKPCRVCCDLSWQRPLEGCFGCGGEYAEERVEPIERRAFSAIALCGVVG